MPSKHAFPCAQDISPRFVATLSALLVACSVSACSSCRRDRPAPAQTDQDSPVPLPPTIALPRVSSNVVRNASEFALPAPCAFGGPVEKLSVAASSVRVIAPRHASGEIALAHEPPAGLGPAPVRGVVNLTTGAAHDIPWFELDTPPLFDRAGDTWIAAFDAPSASSRRQAVLAIGSQPFARVAAGDHLRTAGLLCTSASCALLTTRVSDVAAPGASLFIGPITTPPREWKRTDIDSADRDEIPVDILDFDAATSAARLAFTSPASVRFVAVTNGQAHDEASLPVHFGLVHLAWLGGGYTLAAHGAPVDDRGCAPSGPSVVFQRAHGEPHAASIGAPPYKGMLLDLGGGSAFVWLASVNCLVHDRGVVYLQLLDKDATPVGASIPVGDAVDFAARAIGDTLELFLVRSDGVYRVTAQCAVGSSAQ